MSNFRIFKKKRANVKKIEGKYKDSRSTWTKKQKYKKEHQKSYVSVLWINLQNLWTSGKPVQDEDVKNIQYSMRYKEKLKMLQRLKVSGNTLSSIESIIQMLR